MPVTISNKPILVSGTLFHWIPYTFNPQYDVKVTRLDSTIDSIHITDQNLMEFKFTRLEATLGVGNFEVTINNNSRVYDNRYTGGETVTFYCDMSSGNTVRFIGTVDKVGSEFGGMGNIIKLIGNYISGELLDKTVTKSYSDTEVSVAFKDMIDTYASDYTYSNINTTTKTINVNWEHKPFWEAVAFFCEAAGFSCYVDVDKDFHFFQTDSILNTDEAIVQNDKFIEPLEGFGPDVQPVKNKVIVYGADESGLPIMVTAEDTSSPYNTKETIIKDSSITNETQAQELADAQLSVLKTAPVTGIARNMWLLRGDINPGEQIWISIPSNKIHGKYTIVKVTHSYPGFITEVEVKKSQIGLTDILKDRIKTEYRTQDVKNPNSMKDCVSFSFSDDSKTSSHENTMVLNGSLRLKEVQLIGNWTSTQTNTSYDINNIEIRIGDSQDYNSCVFEYTCNGGITWNEINLNTDTAVSSDNTGKRLRFRVTLVVGGNNPTPSIGSLVGYYK